MDAKIPVAQTNEEREEVVELADDELKDATGGVIMHEVGECRGEVYCPECKKKTTFMCDQPTKVVDKYLHTTKYETGWHCTRCWYQQTLVDYER